MDGMPKLSKNDVSPGAFIAGLFVSAVAARFAQAAWEAAQRESERQRLADARGPSQALKA